MEITTRMEKRLPVYRPLEKIFADAKTPGPWEEEEIDLGFNPTSRLRDDKADLNKK